MDIRLKTEVFRHKVYVELEEKLENEPVWFASDLHGSGVYSKQGTNTVYSLSLSKCSLQNVTNSYFIIGRISVATLNIALIASENILPLYQPQRRFMICPLFLHRVAVTREPLTTSDAMLSGLQTST